MNPEPSVASYHLEFDPHQESPSSVEVAFADGEFQPAEKVYVDPFAIATAKMGNDKADRVNFATPIAEAMKILDLLRAGIVPSRRG